MKLGWTSALTALAAVTVLTACGGGAEEAAAPAAASTSEMPTPSETAVIPTVTLKDACPQVEAGLPSGMFPTQARMLKYVGVLEDLSANGDVETQNAIELMLPETVQYAEVADAQGSELTDALGPYLDGISAFALRCKAAGSSALQ